MKKIYLILVILIFTFTGCTKENTIVLDKIENTTENTTPATTETTEAADETDESEKNEEITSNPTEDATTEAPSEISTTSPTETTTEVSTSPTETTTEAETAPKTEAPTVPPTEAPTAPPTEAPTEAPTILEIVDYICEEHSVTSDYKYGIKKITTTYDNYYVYSDGSKEFSYSYTNDTYDRSGYAATDAELMEESLSIAAANIEFYNEVLTLVNEIRAEAGVHPLVLDTTLCQAATMRSLEMNYTTLFSHTRPNRNSCFTVYHTFSISYSAAGENIAAGQSSPANVVAAWKNSPGHYANMINENFNKLGVGMSNLNFGYGIYWTQLFSN